uniref:Uncharacterized protein n=1 Tax=Candidatus Kentrum sp. LFY TaxID=2126342 RepID=A0A450U9U9_9GAMM|nr:MAG: hypothetical protein BECKLFY1418B_GA0070995_101234 [Candidatus Kentron sp. LFY]
MDVIPAGGAAFQAALFGGGNQKTVGYRCSQRGSIRAHGGLVEGWARPMVTDWTPLPIRRDSANPNDMVSGATLGFEAFTPT